MKFNDERIAELCDVRRNGPVVVAMAEEIRELRKDRARLEHTMQSMHITAQGCRCGQTIRILRHARRHRRGYGIGGTGMSDHPLVDTIRKLTPRQQDALSRICCGDDSCLNPQTAKALAAKGLIDYGTVDQGGGLRLYRAEVASVAVHYAWCVWCSEQPTEEPPCE